MVLCLSQEIRVFKRYDWPGARREGTIGVISLSKQQGAEIQCSPGLLVVNRPEILAYSCEGRSVSLDLENENKNSYTAEVAVLDSWICFLAEKGEKVGFLDRVSFNSHIVVSVERLDLGRSDPGGMHYVNYWELNGRDLVVEYELGVMRVSSRGSVRWHVEWGYMTRISNVQGREIHVEDVGSRQRVLDLETGDIIFSVGERE